MEILVTIVFGATIVAAVATIGLMLLWLIYNGDEVDDPPAMTVVAVALMLGAAMLTGCKQTEYVPVVETHNVYHHTTDTIMKTDSVVDRQTTLIREVDSATMAQYGIQMNAMQKAWLIQTDRLQQEVDRLRELKHDTTVVHDSVPVPVPRTEYVERELTWWQRVRLSLANVVLWTVGLLIGFGVWKAGRTLTFRG